ncbi:SDR family NAD(P)-dependent oxidoreductase [Streptomyces hirsutus]
MSAAGRVAIAGMERVDAAAATPEAWVEQAEALSKDGEMRVFHNASESFRDQMVHLAPELDSVLPEDAANVERV